MERRELKVKSDALQTWTAPSPDDIGEDAIEFLRRLGGPTWLVVPGKDRSRTRAITTLLHGNEPSGLRGLHRWLKTGTTPAVDVVCCIAAVATALTPPGFANRRLPELRDLNRCFQPPFDGPEGRLAAELLARLREANPEALVDIHNTSGLGPAYGATTKLDAERMTITGMFAEHLIVTDVHVGALMEATQNDFPTVTIECGGIRNRTADLVAFEGIATYVSRDDLFFQATAQTITVLKHPIRVRAINGAEIAFADKPLAGVDITLRPDIDRFNYIVLPPSEPLGWLGPRGISALEAFQNETEDIAENLFDLRDGQLFTSRPVRLFMATTDPQIAKDDCLFYAIPAADL